MNSIAQYTVGAVKKIRGHDGFGYSCNLLRNNKKVAEVLEDGWGGGLQFRWLDNKTSAVVNNRTYDGKPHSFNGTVEESLFYAEIVKLPKIPAGEDSMERFPDPDIFVDDLVNHVFISKKITSDLKKQLTIQSKEGEVYNWKISPTWTTEKLIVHALKEHPGATIINNLPIDEVIEIYKKAKLIM